MTNKCSGISTLTLTSFIVDQNGHTLHVFSPKSDLFLRNIPARTQRLIHVSTEFQVDFIGHKSRNYT